LDVERGLRRLKFALAAAWDRRAAIAAALAVAVLCAAGAATGGAGLILTVGAVVAAAVALWSLSDLEAAVRALGGGGSLRGALASLRGQLAGSAERDLQVHPVTGVATREPLAARIAADIASGGGPRLLGAIRFSDYDRLAAFDLEAASHALARFGARLTRAARGDIALGQIDRDTFALWFQNDAAGQDAAAEFAAIAYVAGQDLETDSGVLAPRIEAAAVRYPDDGTDPAHLFVRVTAALNAGGGEAGSDGARINTAEPAETMRSRFMLEQDLNHAIEDGQLKMMFQPVVDIAKGAMIGAEALLRWDHPVLGAVSPADFIPVVEASGMSDRYGLWVLNAACREAKAWQDEGLTGLKVAVNLSARQLADHDLTDKIERTLQRHHLDAAALELELTETAAMTDAARTHQLFGVLRQTGVTLAIDDFGSGYSSLSYLKNLPFDKLKIDREFVADVDKRRDSRAICRALIELGRGLDLLVLAEGVETAAEFEALRALGCEIFQGYFFSKPLSGADFRRLAADPAWVADLLSPVHP
jgi:EAL domain-containing protein (putative c-di-GMP-specific phosphodiesterase class I)/GGDEF domain-containing protein